MLAYFFHEGRTYTLQVIKVIKYLLKGVYFMCMPLKCMQKSIIVEICTHINKLILHKNGMDYLLYGHM